MNGEVKLDISHQGAPVVNHAYIVAAAENVVALHIDLRSKRCEIWATGSDGDDVPTIDVFAGEHAMHLDETKKRDEPTEIRFPEYAGWNAHSASSGRYTVSVCLTRNPA